MFQRSPLSSTAVVLVKSSGTSATREMDPLLRDLNDKKQDFRRSVVSLASELKEARRRLAFQEQSFVTETQTRQAAEKKAEALEEEIRRLNHQLQASSSTADKYSNELNELKSELSVTKELVNSSKAAAESAELQCLNLMNELDEKNVYLKEHDDRVTKLGEQLDLLQKELDARESSQKQLKDEVFRIEKDIMQAVAHTGWSENCELRKLLEQVSPRNLEKMTKLLVAKDEEIALLREEIRVMTAYWKCKSMELEAQLEKSKLADQELNKKVMKLEFCLQVARSQTRKLQREGERRDRVLKEMRAGLAAKGQGAKGCKGKLNFWDTSGFKVALSMSMLVLVAFSKRQ